MQERQEHNAATVLALTQLHIPVVSASCFVCDYCFFFLFEVQNHSASVLQKKLAYGY